MAERIVQFVASVENRISSDVMADPPLNVPSAKSAVIVVLPDDSVGATICAGTDATVTGVAVDDGDQVAAAPWFVTGRVCTQYGTLLVSPVMV